MDIRLVGGSSYANSIEEQIEAYLKQIEQLATDPKNLTKIKTIESEIEKLISQVPNSTERAALQQDLESLKTFVGFMSTDWNVENDPIDTKRDLNLIDTLIDGDFMQVLNHDTNPTDTIINQLDLMQAMVDDLKNCDASIDASRINQETAMIQTIRQAVLSLLPKLDSATAAQIKDLLTNPDHGFPFYFQDVDYFTIDGIISQIKDILKPGSIPTPTPQPEPMPNPGTTPESKIEYDLYEIQQIANAHGSYADVEKLIDDIQLLMNQVSNPQEKAAIAANLATLEQFASNFGNPQANISAGNASLIESLIEGPFNSVLVNPSQQGPIQGPMVLDITMMRALAYQMKECKDPTRLKALEKLFDSYSAKVYAYAGELGGEFGPDIQDKLTNSANGIPYALQSGQFDVLIGMITQVQCEVIVCGKMQ
ncbi:MAG: hypothetical protein K1X28_03555 [Parachlamydiales bacterium]|nr:hypothetical protein [Parachlamydiales bacterium]